MKALRIHTNGDPEVLRWEDVDLEPPRPGEVRLRHTAIGVNYSDVNIRRGGFYIFGERSMPLIIGAEAAGVVEDVAAGVADVKIGDRVAYYTPLGAEGALGAYSEARNIKAEWLVPIPNGISDEQAAAMMLKGLTASCIVYRSYPVKHGDTVLIHAAAGGTGIMLVQLSKHLGATVIGTVGSSEKASIAKTYGCDHIIAYREQPFVEAVRQLAPKGVAAVFDGVGRETFLGSLDCLQLFGTMVSYGNASGAVDPLDLRILSVKGSLKVTRPALDSYIPDRDQLLAAAKKMFDLVIRGALQVQIGHRYALRDAAQAHRDLETRSTIAASVLVP